MEYCEKGELFDYIVKKERLSSAEASLFFYQLINGVEYIHKQGFAHRDLKPENLLLTKDKILKIIDFGLCHDFDGENLLTTKCGSPSYAAPEILKGYPYDGFITDIWCCGIILYAMLCGYLPFDGDNNQEIFQSIVECNPEFPDFLEDDSVNLLSWILNSEPKDRITINEIKYHPFYLKGKNYYTIQYEESDASESDDIRNGYSSIDTRKFGFSTNRRNKGNPHVFNNSKKLKMKEGNHYKNNLYQKIFNRIINAEEDENISKIKAANAKYLLTSGNEKEKENEEKYLCSELIKEVCALFSDEYYQLQNVYNIRNSSAYPDIVKKLADAADRRGRNIHGYVKVRDGETEIDYMAFVCRTGLTGITIPDSVTGIGWYTFFGCIRLTSINICDNNPYYLSIDGVLFSKEKTAIIILYPAGRIGAYTIPANITRIGKCAFSDCTSLTSVTIPNSVTEMGYSAFEGCTGLKSITIPDSVTKIGDSAFEGCAGLTSVTIPDSVTEI